MTSVTASRRPVRGANTNRLMASGDRASCDTQLHCSIAVCGSPACAQKSNSISNSESSPTYAQPSDTTAVHKRDTLAGDPELFGQSAIKRSCRMSSSDLPRPSQQSWCASSAANGCKDSTPRSRRTAPPCLNLVRRCLTPHPVQDMSISENSSDSSSSDDCVELRRRCRSQDDLTSEHFLESAWQMPQYEYDASVHYPQWQPAPGSEWQPPLSEPHVPSQSPILTVLPGPRMPYYDPCTPPPLLTKLSPGTGPRMPFYDPSVPPPSLPVTSPLSMKDSSAALHSLSLTPSSSSTRDSFGTTPSLLQTSPLSSTCNSSGAMSASWPTPPLSSPQNSFEAVSSLSQLGPLSSTPDSSGAASCLSSAWNSSGTAKELTPVKRATDEDPPVVKRSRSSTDNGGGLAQPSGFLPRVFRGGLQWHGPSTYRMFCMQHDEGSDKDRQALEMYSYQMGDTAEVVFRPRPVSRTQQPATTPTRGRCVRRRTSHWAPHSATAPSSEMALTTSPIVPLLPKPFPYSISSKAGLVDSHCHLDFIFSRAGHTGTYAKFRLKHKDTFPDCYEGCVANFCNPATFKLRHKWGDLLSEDGVWGAFGCHPHMAREYNNAIEEQLIQALNHPSVVALGEIGLDYSHKNQCDHDVQQQVFRRQLYLALNRKLPLVIHSRDSTPDTIRILKELVPINYQIHRHCFTGNWQEAQVWLNAFPNLCLGLTPLVCSERTNALAEVARRIPLERLLIETDSPYFLPKQESRNLQVSHPGMAIHVAVRVSSLRNVPVEAVLAAVRDNTKRIYSI